MKTVLAGNDLDTKPRGREKTISNTYIRYTDACARKPYPDQEINER